MYSRLTSLIFFLSVVGLGPIGTAALSSGTHVARHHRAIRQHVANQTSQNVKAAGIRRRQASRKQKHCSARAAAAALGVSVSAGTTGQTDSNAGDQNDNPAQNYDPTTTTTASSTRTHTHTTHHATASSTPAAGGQSNDASNGSSGGSSGYGGEFDQSPEYTGGDATYYGIGLGACGWTNSEPDMIAAMAFERFDSYAVGTAAVDNPNLNPVCGKYVEASLPGLGTVVVEIVDRCGGCMLNTSLDFSMAAFNKLTNNGVAVGRFHDLEWHFVDKPN